MWKHARERKQEEAEQRSKQVEYERRYPQPQRYEFGYSELKEAIANYATIYEYFSGYAKHYISCRVSPSDVEVSSYYVRVKAKAYIAWAGLDVGADWVIREACDDLKGSVMSRVKDFLRAHANDRSAYGDICDIERIEVTVEY